MNRICKVQEAAHLNQMWLSEEHSLLYITNKNKWIFWIFKIKMSFSKICNNIFSYRFYDYDLMKHFIFYLSPRLKKMECCWKKTENPKEPSLSSAINCATCPSNGKGFPSRVMREVQSGKGVLGGLGLSGARAAFVINYIPSGRQFYCTSTLCLNLRLLYLKKEKGNKRWIRDKSQQCLRQECAFISSHAALNKKKK